MISGLALTTLLVTLGGAPVKRPEVTSGDGAAKHMGTEITLLGQIERVELGKGQKTWLGTAVVLDDDTVVYVTYGAPPEGWEKLLGERVRVDGVLRPSLSEHEQSLMAPHLRNPGPPKPAPRTVAGLLGERVRLSGLAQDAKGGAVVLLGKSPLYVAGLERWPAEVNGKRVALGGRVVEKQYLPEAQRGPKGEISQGASGKQLVLEDPTWRSLAPAGERVGVRGDAGTPEPHP